MDSRNLNGLENQSSLSRRSTLVGSRAHLGRMRIHGSIRGIHASRILLKLGSLRRPLRTIVSRKLESRKLILEHLDHLAKSRVRTGRCQRKTTHGLLSVAIDTELQCGIKVATIDSRTATRSPLGGIQLALQTFPSRLLCRKQCDTPCRPSLSAPLSTAILRLLNLILGGQLSSLRRTHCRSFILTKAIIRHIEDLFVVQGAQCTHIRDNRLGFSVLQEDIDVVSRNLDM